MRQPMMNPVLGCAMDWIMIVTVIPTKAVIVLMATESLAAVMLVRAALERAFASADGMDHATGRDQSLNSVILNLWITIVTAEMISKPV